MPIRQVHVAPFLSGPPIVASIKFTLDRRFVGRWCTLDLRVAVGTALEQQNTFIHSALVCRRPHCSELSLVCGMHAAALYCKHL